MHSLPQVGRSHHHALMFDVMQTLANGCSVDHSSSCITLVILWIVLMVCAAQVLIALFTRGGEHIERKEEEKK